VLRSKFFVIMIVLGTCAVARAENHVWWAAYPLSGSAAVAHQGTPSSSLDLLFDGSSLSSWLITAIYDNASGGTSSWSLDYLCWIPGFWASDETFPDNALNNIINQGTLGYSAGYFAKDSAGINFGGVDGDLYVLHHFKLTVPAGFPGANIYAGVGNVGFTGNDTEQGYENVAFAGNLPREGTYQVDQFGNSTEPIPVITIGIPEPATCGLLVLGILAFRRTRPIYLKNPRTDEQD
jgi:hypothetical protein